eukprot:512584-Rhodomonas_salina.1
MGTSYRISRSETTLSPSSSRRAGQIRRIPVLAHARILLPTHVLTRAYLDPNARTDMHGGTSNPTAPVYVVRAMTRLLSRITKLGWLVRCHICEIQCKSLLSWYRSY